MSELYQELNNAGRPGKLHLAEEIFARLAAGELAARTAYYGLCTEVIARELADDPNPAESQHRIGEFTAESSAALVHNEYRVAGFLTAIGRMPSAKLAIDAGCGASALLSAGAAVQHPRAEVFAYELHEPSVRCAQGMLALLGLDDRVSVIHQDVLQADLPTVDLAVSETFGRGLLSEKGVEICGALGRVARDMVPSRVDLLASTSAAGEISPDWQHAARIDLRDATPLIEGSFTTITTGIRQLNVYAAFYADHDIPVLTGHDLDSITQDTDLGVVILMPPANRISFSYPPGAEDIGVRPTITVQSMA